MSRLRLGIELASRLALGCEPSLPVGEPRPPSEERWDASSDDRSGSLASYGPQIALDTRGAVALSQDAEELVRIADVISDDTPFSQWYVGTCAATIAANSPTSTVYVDDVTVRLP